MASLLGSFVVVELLASAWAAAVAEAGTPFRVPTFSLSRADGPRDVDTLRLKSIQIPDRTLDLLESFARSNGRIPPGTERVQSLNELPPELRRHIGSGPDQQYVWYAWSTGVRTWLLTGALSLERSRERGRPVLEVRSYDEHGYLEESGAWIRTGEDQWDRCGW